MSMIERRHAVAKRIEPIVASFLCFLLGVHLAGCGRQALPTSPTPGELRFIQLPAPRRGILLDWGGIYVEGEVTPERAATLELDYEWEGGEIEIRLHVPAHAVSKPATWSLTLYPNSFVTEVSFVGGPAGLEFLRPAKLRIEAEGLDLSGINPESVGLYYYNDQGFWELIEPIALKVEIDEGEIRGLWWLDHFSRYALASR